MSWARHHVRELWKGIDEIDHLRNEEKEQGLGKVGKNGDACERHAGDIAVGVTHENASGITVLCPQGEGDGDEW